MFTNEFVAALPVTIDRNSVLSQLRAQEAALADQVIPSYQAAVGVFPPTYQIRSQAMKNIQSVFTRRLVTPNKRSVTNWVGHVLDAANTALEVIGKQIDIIEALKTKDIARDGIDLQTANVLMVSGLNDFFIDYSLKVLLWTYSSEGSVTNAHVNPDSLTRAERSWLSANINGLVDAVAHYSVTPNEYATALKSIAKVPVANIDFESGMAVDQKRIDPLKFNFIGESVLVDFVSKVSYAIGRMWVERAVKKHNERKELKTALELRLLELKMATEGQIDAALSKQIVYTENRLSKLSYEIAQFEG